MENSERSILLVGGHNTGKTHYGGQLLGRVRGEDCRLQLRGTPDSIAPLQEVFDCLGQGVCASHTPATVYQEIIFPLVYRRNLDANEEKFDLVWPDYGGEQIGRFVSDRRFSPEWRTRIARTTGWLVFLRPSQVKLADDFLSRPQGHINESGQQSDENQVELALSDSAFFIELLQILLFASERNMATPLESPRLALALTCRDEIDAPEGRLPAEELRARLPLVAEFIEANWAPEAHSIWGLSALGKALHQDKADNDFMDLGPQKFGYVIRPDGIRDSNLTLPLEAAFGILEDNKQK